MRLFVAVNLPDAEKHRLWEAAAPVRAAAPGVRWTAEASVHLTLKFLGEVADARVDGIAGRIARVAASHAPFTLRLGGIGGFPTLGRARVWWIGIEPEPALGALQADVEDAMADEGFPREARSFSPHLTIGRLARGARPVQSAAATAAGATFGYRAEWSVDTLDLMRSTLRRQGAVYDAVLRAVLGGGA